MVKDLYLKIVFIINVIALHLHAFHFFFCVIEKHDWLFSDKTKDISSHTNTDFRSHC